MDPFHVICISKQALYFLSSFLLMKLYVHDNAPLRKPQGSHTTSDIDVLLQVIEVRILKHKHTLCCIYSCTHTRQHMKLIYQNSLTHPLTIPPHTPLSNVSCILDMSLSNTHTHTCSQCLLIIAIISTWTETKFDKTSNDKCNLGNSPSRSLFLPLSYITS